MIQTDTFEGAKARVQNFRFKVFTVTVLMLSVLVSIGCGPTAGPGSTPGGDETAATVNGKAIRMEDVEKGLKAQGQGQEAKMSPLEIASARLTILQQLIQAEVLFQKAEKEQSVPNDDDINTEVNKRKTTSGLSSEEFKKQMEAAGETEASWRENVKKELALKKLQDKITGKVETPNDSEIAAFYNGNKDQFKNKRGAELGAIVFDPAYLGEGDTTKNEAEANLKAKEVGTRAMTGGDFATLARENSEDLETRSKGGDWRYFTEDELRQSFGAGVADYVMTKMQAGQIVPQALPVEGKVLIVKLQRKQEKDEDLTLESPGVRQRVNDMLINARKNLLWQSYMAIAINEAKVENYLAKKVVDNPNELSGARPAVAETPAANSNTSATPANTNTAPAANTNAKPGNSAGLTPPAANANKPK
jgi:peptidyl-prolyl cis-trans isomerase SurA